MSPADLFAAASSYLDIAAPYVAAGALVIAIGAVAYAIGAHGRIRRLAFRRGDSVEDTLGELLRRTREFQVFREELELYLKNAEGRLQKSLRGFGLVRFNPFQGDGSGGNQSFAAAFLDEHGDGVVFSAIYARAGQTSVYAKPIKKGASQFELTAEERDAISIAATRTKKTTKEEKSE